jgi:hypothetical protein
MLFFLGAIAGNCNISEAIFITFSIALLICAKTLKLKFIDCLLALRVSNLISFLIGSIVGMLAIVLSPGFWDRASSQTTSGIPKDVSEFGFRFLKSLLKFA